MALAENGVMDEHILFECGKRAGEMKEREGGVQGQAQRKTDDGKGPRGWAGWSNRRSPGSLRPPLGLLDRVTWEWLSPFGGRLTVDLTIVTFTVRACGSRAPYVHTADDGHEPYVDTAMVHVHPCQTLHTTWLGSKIDHGIWNMITKISVSELVPTVPAFPDEICARTGDCKDGISSLEDHRYLLAFVF
ncbi:hypothetical protein JB92DRAFT_2833108 [Gautieria morchelliformis]|nr:hypothetical protein JB92DRAFT_2833108 [Gautieria morchelliformis]